MARRDAKSASRRVKSVRENPLEADFRLSPAVTAPPAGAVGTRPRAFERVIGTIATAPNRGLIVQPDGYIMINRKRSYGPDMVDLCRRSAAMSIEFSRVRSPRTYRCSNQSSMSW
jgi:hypothetical protein